jgi:iron only hydrogenase large subunit-like protein
MKQTKDIKKLIELLNRKEELVAMLAPSFLVDFSYPEIIGRLKELGFKKVVEVSTGAIETNKQLKALLKLHPDKKYITNACPGIVRFIKKKFPELTDFLTPIDSPMIATAKIVQKKYPGCKKVFIGPCLMKKKEVEEYPDLDILALTYREINQILKEKDIVLKNKKIYSFDLVGEETRLYPISGGLAQSSGLIQKMTDPECDVISGFERIEKAIKNFPKDPEIKILDILFCDGGCISGPGIISKDSLDKKRQKIINHWIND